MPATRGGDPALDRWGSEYRPEVQGIAYVLRSCGPDAVCENADDVLRHGGALVPAEEASTEP